MSQNLRQEQVDSQAREWFMLRGERALSESERQAFDVWIAAPEHRQSYRQLEQICSGLAQLVAGPKGEALRQLNGVAGLLDSCRQRWAQLCADVKLPAPQLGFALASVLALGVWLAVPAQGPQLRSYMTQVAETRVLLLEDGSEVTLGAGTEITSSFSEGRRDVTLLQGQAFFVVSKDPERPFYVNTASASIRVVGTRFDVRRNLDQVKVSVEEGIVDVVHRATAAGYSRDLSQPREDAGAAVKPVRLLAGQQLRLDQQAASAVLDVDQNELASWREGKLIYHNARLSEVVADANRYRQGSIILSADHLDDLRVTASFRVDQVDTMVSMLEQSLPVRVFYEPNGRVVIWPRN